MRIHHLANGRIRGTGSVASLTKDYTFEGHGNVHGRYRQLPLGDRCAFDFIARIIGDDAAGFPITGSYHFRGLFLQRSGPDFYTAGTNKTCVRGYMCTGADEFFYEMDPRGRNWKLSLQLESTRERIRGTGELLLIAYRLNQTNILGRKLFYAVRGRSNERTRDSFIHMAGIEADKGSSLYIRANEISGIKSIRGKVLGQKVSSDGPFEIEMSE
jgi:hypothetical protein